MDRHPAASQNEGNNSKETKYTSMVKHDSTIWLMKPSFKYDVLTFLNTLSGDPFYRKYYQKEFGHFDTLITPAARAAIASLKRKVRDESGNIISAFLSLYFSATDAETLDDMLATLKDSETMQKILRDTPYYSDDGWRLYNSVRPELKTIFQYLQEIDFTHYWREHVLPLATAKIKDIEPQLPRYNVIEEVERLLGHPLPSDTITVYMLYFSQPHGIRITGTRFLTDVAWPSSIVLRNAVHEMMHPPYILENDAELRKALELLKNDRYLMEKVEHHDPSFGYNSFDGFIEEDVVQALEQLVNDSLGIAVDARTRWKQNDDGMHVFAVALYGVMKEEQFGQSGQSIRDFLMRQVNEGRLKAGQIAGRYREFYGEAVPR